MKNLEKKFKELYNKVIYCFINNTIIVIKLRKYKNFLVNQKYFTNYKKFFYYNYNLLQKKYYNLNNKKKDLKNTSKPKTQKLIKLCTKSKKFCS